MLQKLRKKIDQIDLQLIKLLAQRLELSEQIYEEIHQTGEVLHQRTRDIEVLDKAKLKGNALGLEDAFITDLYAVILKKSREMDQTNDHQAAL